jgi:long-chain acyl-CoA synthetase
MQPDHELTAGWPESLGEFFSAACARHGTHTAFACLGGRLTFADLERRSADLAAWLRSDLGLHRGDRVAVMLPNILQYPIVLHAILRAGLVVVNVNPLYTARELRHQLRDSGAVAMFVLANCAGNLETVIGETPVRHVIVTELGDELPWLRRRLANFVVRHVKKLVPAYQLSGHHRWLAIFKASQGTGPPPETVGPDDLAFLQYTGGTTGLSKGAMLTHGNVLANLAQCASLQERLLAEVRPGEDVFVLPLPIYHAAALIPGLMLFLYSGGCQVLIPNPRDLDGFVRELKRWRVTGFVGINTLFAALLQRQDFRALDFSRLRFSGTGGAPLHRVVAEEWLRVTGSRIQVAYGLTEASPVVSGELTDTAGAWSGNVGPPLTDTEISLRDESGLPVPEGEPGELWVRGPQVMKGYWERADATAEVLTPDGYLRTGDMARLTNDGSIEIVDRKKDMILVSGFNVFPNEIEDIATRHEDVVEAACVGVPDDRTGEAVVLYVVMRNGATLDRDDLAAYLRSQLTAYKVPRRIEARAELPKTNVGKILRRVLRDDAVAASQERG